MSSWPKERAKSTLQKPINRRGLVLLEAHSLTTHSSEGRGRKKRDRERKRREEERRGEIGEGRGGIEEGRRGKRKEEKEERGE